MAQLKHRPFNAHRFLDKLRHHEAYLINYLTQWSTGLIPGLPDPFSVDSFKDFLKSPPQNCPPYDEMIEGLYRAYDLSTPRGHEYMCDALKTTQSVIHDIHDLPVEALAVRLLVEDSASFNLAECHKRAREVEKFHTFRGKGARTIANVPNAVLQFTAELQKIFAERKGSTKVLVRDFQDGHILNFLIYHEERTRAEIQLQANGATVTVDSFIFRPARQDFISYFPAEGKLQIDSPIQKERQLIRQAFGEVCLGDKDFFEAQGSTALIDLTPLAMPGFQFVTDRGDSAVLTELMLKIPSAEKPTIAVRSTDVFAALDNGRMRHILDDSTRNNYPGCNNAGIVSAKISLKIDGLPRAKAIELKAPNSLSFNRATHSEKVMRYLVQWGLLEEWTLSGASSTRD